MASADPHGAVSGAPLPPGLKPAPPYLDIPLHVAYIAKLANSSGSLGYHLTTHLRLNAIYWAVAALHLLGKPDTLDRDELLKFVMSCWDDEAGAFGSYPQHDAHILSTLSGIQVLAIKDALHLLDEGGKRDRLVKYILGLQDPKTGAFSGDTTHLEQDTRFLYCALQALAILSSPSSSSATNGSDASSDRPTPLSQLDRELTISHVLACRNFDGCFGTTPGSESHAGQAFVCVGALSILQALDRLDDEGGVQADEAASRGGGGTWGNSATAVAGTGVGGAWKGRDRLATWLAQRQLPCGGLNGRPQKLEDVCYSWWVLSALAMLDRLHWISSSKLEAFILSAQDPDNGGISDRPGNVADVFHTLFGVAGLSLLGGEHAKGLTKVDPVFCLPADVSERLDLQGRMSGAEGSGRT